ncbi:MAG: hypothetical protein GY729_15350 [Desulfobacteraceae bacterium]|nr:hypothetical protein [Desulfobacteraceae bacterium]
MSAFSFQEHQTDEVLFSATQGILGNQPIKTKQRVPIAGPSTVEFQVCWPRPGREMGAKAPQAMWLTSPPQCPAHPPPFPRPRFSERM